MKKIPNGKEIIRQEIEKAMRALQVRSESELGYDRIIDELNKCGNKSFFFDEFEDGKLQVSCEAANLATLDSA